MNFGKILTSNTIFSFIRKLTFSILVEQFPKLNYKLNKDKIVI